MIATASGNEDVWKYLLAEASDDWPCFTVPQEDAKTMIAADRAALRTVELLLRVLIYWRKLFKMIRKI